MGFEPTCIDIESVAALPICLLRLEMVGMEGFEPSRYYYFATESQPVLYCQFQHIPMKWCHEMDSNHQRPALQAGALPIGATVAFKIINHFSKNKKVELVI